MFPRRAAQLALLVTIATTNVHGAPAVPADNGLEALNAIVGTWQSNVVDERSARSTCVWTPQHLAVICDQTISTPQGPRHATNLYTFNAEQKRYVYYGVNTAGQPIAPVPLSIDGVVWVYGGGEPSADGVTYRTVNDFSGKTFYTWQRQSSRDGKAWTTLTGGRAERVSKDRS